MKKKLSLFMFITISCLQLFAQYEKYNEGYVILVDPSPSIFQKPAGEDLDKVRFKVLYDFNFVIDTINPDNQPIKTIVELQIGNKIDKYFDYNASCGDSILWFADLSKNTHDYYYNEAMYRRNGYISNICFINYPQEGKVTESEYAMGRYEYTEDIPKIKWKLESGKEEIAGYDCKKATCYFSGRYYTAWYAPEIPISKGPWKFGGLPGLILKMQDNNNQISWNCIGLENGDGNHDIFRVEKDTFYTNKKEYHNMISDGKRNKAKYIMASGMVQGGLPADKIRKFPYNAIELEEYAHEKK